MSNLDYKFYCRPTHTPGRLVLLKGVVLPTEYLGKIGMLLSQFLDDHYIVLVNEEKLILRIDEFKLL